MCFTSHDIAHFEYTSSNVLYYLLGNAGLKPALHADVAFIHHVCLLSDVITISSLLDVEIIHELDINAI